MSEVDLVVGILAGVVQGLLEWLPISSQGNLALFLTAVGTDPAIALQLALFLQVGTTLSATAYYDDDIRTAARTVPDWRLETAYDERTALVSYLLVATVVTALVGVPLYVFAVDLASELSGGVFVVLVGLLLVVTGLLQRTSASLSMGEKRQPTLSDSLLVGAVQGIAILPGISRSGVTASALLVRRYEPPEAFRLSFLLSIPASIGAAGLTLVGAGGLPGIDPAAALAALLASAVVGYLMIDAIMQVVDQISVWLACLGLGALAVCGGTLAVLL
jgi:undecaprenyl-diphosphatase